MKKYWIPLLLLLVVLTLGACNPQASAPANASTEPPETQESDESNPTSEPQETAGSSSAEPVLNPTSSGPAACSVVSSQPDPTIQALFPPPTEDDWTLGPEDAVVTFIEYSELQCPYCAALEPQLSKLYSNYPDEVRLVFRHFPLPSHDKALLGAQAIEAAGKQDETAFFELKDFLFETQQSWAGYTPESFEEYLLENVEQFDLDKGQFEKDLKDKDIIAKVEKAQQEAMQIQIPGTPFVLFNNQVYNGPRDYASLEGLIGLAKLEDQQFTECPPTVIDTGKDYTATIKPEKGDIVIQLYDDEAPVTVNSFVFLAQNDWFDNVIFHRVIPDFVAQSGDPSGTGMGFPGYAYDNEINMDLKFDEAGVVGMANAGPNSNGSQFFIAFQALPQLDGQYTIFGKVIEGLDVAGELTPRDPQSGGILPEGDLILDVEIGES